MLLVAKEIKFGKKPRLLAFGPWLRRHNATVSDKDNKFGHPGRLSSNELVAELHG